jgi:hypothetical protein
VSHQSPANRCPGTVNDALLMCCAHWSMVPAPLRAAMWNAWADGTGTGTTAHRAARDYDDCEPAL